MPATSVPLSLRLIQLMFQTLGNLFPARFGRIAYNMWFTTTRFKTPERENSVIASANTHDLDVHGLPVHCYSWGDDQPDRPLVLFIHGWSGRGSQAHAFVEPLVAAGFRVISFDAPSHGNTPGTQTSGYQVVDTLLRLQQEHGVFDGVITHSFGGMILAASSRFGFTTKKAVCICPPEGLDRLLDNFADALTLPDTVKQAMLSRLRESYGTVLKDVIDTVANASRLEYPALIIHDRDDPEIPWQGSERLHDAWPGSSLMLTDGLKHHRILRDEAVVRAAVDYLTGSGSSAG